MIITEEQLAQEIHEIVLKLETNHPDYINLADPAFEVLSCSRLRLYRVAKNHCHKWNYDYQPVTYKSSRAHYRRPFEKVKDEDRWEFTKPALIKRTT